MIIAASFTDSFLSKAIGVPAIIDQNHLEIALKSAQYVSLCAPYYRLRFWLYSGYITLASMPKSCKKFAATLQQRGKPALR